MVHLEYYHIVRIQIGRGFLMFVLMDIEWVTNRMNHISPTQIAALRVDDSWNATERFYARIRPKDATFHLWNHMAYTGGQPSDFLFARGIFQALTDLKAWLREDDTICFWTRDSMNILKSVYNLILKEKVPQRMIALIDYVFPYLSERKDAYQICSAMGNQASGPKHQAENDVQAIRQALACMQYPASLLAGAPPTAPDIGNVRLPITVDKAQFPYQFDVCNEVFHKKGCGEIPAGTVLTGHPNLKYLFRKKLKPCPACMRNDMRKFSRERNMDIINRSQYRFVFAESSDVFHRRDCGLILSTTSEIKGSHYYCACEKTGRRPCKVCNPTDGNWYSPIRKPSQVQPPEVVLRSMTASEQNALTRFQKAQNERYAREHDAFESKTERDDFYTLTQPRFAFWAAAGYANFHTRDCRKLQGLTNLKGFSRYKDAVRSGHTPCKCCKPTAKMDIVCSLPITSRKRSDESIKDLQALCQEYHYPSSFENGEFSFSTPVGKWKIDTTSRPYIIYHINLIRTPYTSFYHRQPRMFLSMLDCMAYVRRHDTELHERTIARRQNSIACTATY